MSKILITGGAGFIGSSLAEKLSIDNRNYIVIADNLLTGYHSYVPIKDNVEFVKVDVNNFEDISSVITHNNFDYIFHFAAVVGVARTLNDPMSVLRDIDGIRNILLLSKNCKIKRIFFSSSSEVYGEPFEVPQCEETTPLNSRLPYAVVKNLCEVYLKTYYKEYGLEYTIFRFFNTYGPKQSSDFVLTKFIKAAANNEDIIIYGDGKQSRTFLYIDDNVDTMCEIFNNKLCRNSVINIGSSIETSIKQLAEIVIKVTDSRSNIVFVDPLEEGDIQRRKPDTSKMQQIINRDIISLEQGIRKTFNYICNLKEHEIFHASI